MRIAIIAALSGELKPLVAKGWQRLPAKRVSGVKMWQRSGNDLESVAVCAGMGSAAALRAFAAAEYLGALDSVISVGWAGALTDACPPGSASKAKTIIDAQTGERFLAASDTGLTLVTAARVAASPEKNRLARTYGAALVDMEAAAIARLAQMRDIPFYCIKGISDAADAQLPDFNRFITPLGQMQMAPFLAYAAVHPELWPGLLALSRHSRTAAKSIAAMTDQLLQEIRSAL